MRSVTCFDGTIGQSWQLGCRTFWKLSAQRFSVLSVTVGTAVLYLLQGGWVRSESLEKGGFWVWLEVFCHDFLSRPVQWLFVCISKKNLFYAQGCSTSHPNMAKLCKWIKSLCPVRKSVVGFSWSFTWVRVQYNPRGFGYNTHLKLE